MRRKHGRMLIIGLLVTGAILFAALGPSSISADFPDGSCEFRSYDASVTPPTIDRELAPVIVKGADLPLMAGVPTDELFVYAYKEGGFEQIPFQVDEVEEVEGSRHYTDTVGSPLEDDDEVVFMVSDLGGLPSPIDIASTLPISETVYEIEVTDPLVPGASGWAFIARSDVLVPTFTETYASFEPATDRITTTEYSLGFLADHPGLDYLALHGSGQDILDRTKLRLTVFGIPVTENMPPAPPPVAVKDGPVRVIVRNRGLIGYRALVRTVLSEDLLPGTTAARLSTDFSAEAAGATFYNANSPAGATIDGDPTESIAASPLSPWWQVTHETGTLVQVGDSSGVGGTQTNYYKDDDTVDPADTGDQMSYGDTGLSVTSPNESIFYDAALYILPPGQSNIGSGVADHAMNPVQVTAVARKPARYRVYLPVTLKAQ